MIEKPEKGSAALLITAGIVSGMTLAQAVNAEGSQTALKKTGSGKQPNILFIYSDDHSLKTISAYGYGMNKTPNIDKIANEGAIFKRSYVANSICCPARACVLTGKHSHKNGMLTNGSAWNGSQQIFPRLLKKAGYQTALIGKWHMHPIPSSEFDFWMVLSGNRGQGHYYNPEFETINGPKRITGYSTDVIADESIKWLEKRDPNKPFLMMTQFKAPHVHRMPALRYLNKYEDQVFPTPDTYFDDFETRKYAEKCWMKMFGMPLANLNITPPKAEYKKGTPVDLFGFLDDLTEEQRTTWLDTFEARNNEFRKLQKENNWKKGDRGLSLYKYQRFIKDYLRCVDGIDDNVGKLLNWLKKNGLDKNTIVVYSSDQSFFIGEHGWIDKRWMYEESLSTPLVMRWPGHIKPGLKINEMVQNIDYAPTFLQAAGVKVPDDIQGVSLIPLFQGESPENWRKSIYYHYYMEGAYNMPLHDGIRNDRYKLINFYANDDWEFYDLKNDPQELKNSYDNPEYKSMIEEMKKDLDKLRKQYDLTPDNFKSTKKIKKHKKKRRKKK